MKDNGRLKEVSQTKEDSGSEGAMKDNIAIIVDTEIWLCVT